MMLVGSRRRMCPVHRHFRSLMTSGICCVLLQSCSLEIVSGHLIRRICRLTFKSSALVCFHVSEPYNKTYFTLELKMISLVLRRMFLLFQTGFRVTQTCRAFPILDLMSSSVPPVLLIMLPRQVKPSIYSMFYSAIWMSVLVAVLKQIKQLSSKYVAKSQVKLSISYNSLNRTFYDILK